MMIESISFEIILLPCASYNLYNLMVFSISPVQCHDDNDHAYNLDGSRHDFYRSKNKRTNINVILRKKRQQL